MVHRSTVGTSRFTPAHRGYPCADREVRPTPPSLPGLCPHQNWLWGPTSDSGVQFFLQPESCLLPQRFPVHRSPTAEPCTHRHTGLCTRVGVCTRVSVCTRVGVCTQEHMQARTRAQCTQHRRTQTQTCTHRHTDPPPLSPHAATFCPWGLLAWVLLDPAGSSSHLQLGGGPAGPHSSEGGFPPSLPWKMSRSPASHCSDGETEA